MAVVRPGVSPTLAARLAAAKGTDAEWIALGEVVCFILVADDVGERGVEGWPPTPSPGPAAARSGDLLTTHPGFYTVSPSQVWRPACAGVLTNVRHAERKIRSDNP